MYYSLALVLSLLSRCITHISIKPLLVSYTLHPYTHTSYIHITRRTHITSYKHPPTYLQAKKYRTYSLLPAYRNVPYPRAACLLVGCWIFPCYFSPTPTHTHTLSRSPSPPVAVCTPSRVLGDGGSGVCVGTVVMGCPCSHARSPPALSASPRGTHSVLSPYAIEVICSCARTLPRAALPVVSPPACLFSIIALGSVKFGVLWMYMYGPMRPGRSSGPVPGKRIRALTPALPPTELLHACDAVVSAWRRFEWAARSLMLGRVCTGRRRCARERRGS